MRINESRERCMLQANRQYHWAGANSILSEVGTLHMEFTYLSDVTGKKGKQYIGNNIFIK